MNLADSRLRSLAVGTLPWTCPSSDATSKSKPHVMKRCCLLLCIDTHHTYHYLIQPLKPYPPHTFHSSTCPSSSAGSAAYIHSYSHTRAIPVVYAESKTHSHTTCTCPSSGPLAPCTRPGDTLRHRPSREELRSRLNGPGCAGL